MFRCTCYYEPVKGLEETVDKVKSLVSIVKHKVQFIFTVNLYSINLDKIYFLVKVIIVDIKNDRIN